MNSAAAWLTASTGLRVPSVQTSTTSLSHSVSWPTRVFSMVKLALRTGVKMASIGITPMGWPSCLLRSAVT